MSSLADAATGNMVVQLCRMPIDFHAGQGSFLTLLAGAGYFERRDELTPQAVAEVLRDNPEFVTAWLAYSGDKRTSWGWYFRDCRDGGYFRSPPVSDFELGSIEANIRISFSDAAAGCAEFIVREVGGISDPRSLRP